MAKTDAIPDTATDRTLARLPSDGEVWRNRHRLSWTDWADRVGLSQDTVSRHMAKRGFRREANGTALGRMTHAPCQRCGESFPIAWGSQVLRTCVPCRTKIRDSIRRKQSRGVDLSLAEERLLYLMRRDDRRGR